MQEVFQLIQEDRKTWITDMMAVMPLARTPMSKDGAKGLEDYHKSLVKWLDLLTPWNMAKRNDLRNLRKRIKSGQVVVIPDGPGDPLSKDATLQEDS